MIAWNRVLVTVMFRENNDATLKLGPFYILRARSSSHVLVVRLVGLPTFYTGFVAAFR